jgi:hypothetical protein
MAVVAREARYKRQETTTAPVVTISGRSHAASQAGGALGTETTRTTRTTWQVTAFQPAEAQLAVPQYDNERGGDAHSATERRAEEDEEEEKDEEVELRMPGSFDFEDHDRGVVGAAGVGTIDPFDAVCTRTYGGACR